MSSKNESTESASGEDKNMEHHENEEDEVDSEEEDNDDSEEDDSSSDSSIGECYDDTADDYYIWSLDDNGGRMKMLKEKKRAPINFLVDLTYPRSDSVGLFGLVVGMCHPSNANVSHNINKYAPYAKLKLQAELTHAKCVSLYFDTSRLTTTKLLPVYVTFFSGICTAASDHCTRLVDLKRLTADTTDLDVFTAVKNIVEQEKLNDKIVSIVGDNQNVKEMLAAHFPTDFGLINLDDNFTKLLCELFEYALKKTSPIDFLEVMSAVRSYGSWKKRARSKNIELSWFNWFDDELYHKNYTEFDVFIPLFPKEQAQYFVTNFAGFWYRIRQETHWMKRYFEAEETEEDKSDGNYALLKRFFCDPTVSQYFELAYNVASYYYGAIQSAQNPRYQNIVDHLNFIQSTKEHLNGLLAKPILISENLEKLPSEIQTQFKENITEFYRTLERDIEQHFSTLLVRFQSLKWVTLHGIPKEEDVFGSLSSLPIGILCQINLEQLRAEVALLHEFISTEIKCEKDICSRNIAWSFGHTPSGKRWAQVFRLLPSLSNLFSIVGYVFALPSGFNDTLVEAEEDLSRFWQKELELNGSNASLKRVKVALQLRHHDLFEPIKVIETFSKKPSLFQAVLSKTCPLQH